MLQTSSTILTKDGRKRRTQWRQPTQTHWILHNAGKLLEDKMTAQCTLNTKKEIDDNQLRFIALHSLRVDTTYVITNVSPWPGRSTSTGPHLWCQWILMSLQCQGTHASHTILVTSPYLHEIIHFQITTKGIGSLKSCLQQFFLYESTVQCSVERKIQKNQGCKQRGERQVG